MTEQSIPCPNCQTNISFDAQQLLMGVQFTCPNCNAKIGLAQESKQTVQDSLDHFEKLKEDVSKDKPN